MVAAHLEIVSCLDAVGNHLLVENHGCRLRGLLGLAAISSFLVLLMRRMLLVLIVFVHLLVALGVEELGLLARAWSRLIDVDHQIGAAAHRLVL